MIIRVRIEHFRAHRARDVQSESSKITARGAPLWQQARRSVTSVLGPEECGAGYLCREVASVSEWRANRVLRGLLSPSENSAIFQLPFNAPTATSCLYGGTAHADHAQVRNEGRTVAVVPPIRTANFQTWCPRRSQCMTPTGERFNDGRPLEGPEEASANLPTRLHLLWSTERTMHRIERTRQIASRLGLPKTGTRLDCGCERPRQVSESNRGRNVHARSSGHASWVAAGITACTFIPAPLSCMPIQFVVHQAGYNCYHTRHTRRTPTSRRTNHRMSIPAISSSV